MLTMLPDSQNIPFHEVKSRQVIIKINYPEIMLLHSHVGEIFLVAVWLNGPFNGEELKNSRSNPDMSQKVTRMRTIQLSLS